MRRNRVGGDQKVMLDQFLRYGVGVCRHSALTAGLLLELLIKEKYLDGQVSVDRNTVEGGHAWARYTNTKGTVYIIDITQEFFGTLDEAVVNGKWDYSREEDKKFMHLIRAHRADS
ncbi:hypothetical protein KA005_61120, partial [bacterium]|nr:hypothetical protein [bacterium]